MLTTLSVALVFVALSVAQDPDILRDVSGLIKSKGYPVEKYDVVTSDGYVLNIQRIPHGLNNKGVRNKQVVYLQHGLLADSTNWVLNFQHNSLGFVLADAGYDVWMGNSRGNSYSRKHKKLNPKEDAFWDFSFDEMALIDLPETIDYVLKKTKQKKLYYVGHSQGTTILFAMLSALPDYNDKINVGIALAPVVYETNVKGVLPMMANYSAGLTVASKVFGVQEFFPSEGMMSNSATRWCNTQNKIVCKNAAFMICGPDSVQLNDTRLPVYISHFPAGTSVKNVVHHAQYIQNGRFEYYDYLVSNSGKYGSKTPPLFPLKNVAIPIGLLWGENDWLGNPKDVARLSKELKNVVSNFRVPFDLWNHLDFVIGMEADKYLYTEILRLIKKY